MKPLKLEDGGNGVFLENEFEIEGDNIHYRLKNSNVGQMKVWRYQDFDSYAPYAQKRATLIATLKKVDKNASSSQIRYESAMHKLKEFTDKGCPRGLTHYACCKVGWESNHKIWFALAYDH